MAALRLDYTITQSR